MDSGPGLTPDNQVAELKKALAEERAAHAATRASLAAMGNWIRVSYRLDTPPQPGTIRQKMFGAFKTIPLLLLLAGSLMAQLPPVLRNQWSTNAPGDPVLGDARISANLTVDSNLTVSVEDFSFLASLPAHKEGRVFYDTNSHTLCYYLDRTNITVNIGQEQHVRVYNPYGVTITNGSAITVTGAHGQAPQASWAQATTNVSSQHYDILGLATEDIPSHTEGLITTLGIVHDLDTHLFGAGDLVYLSTNAGAFTATAPSNIFCISLVGIVLVSHPNAGSIFVHPRQANHASDIVGLSSDIGRQILATNQLNTQYIGDGSSPLVNLYFNGSVQDSGWEWNATAQEMGLFFGGLSVFGLTAEGITNVTGPYMLQGTNIVDLMALYAANIGAAGSNNVTVTSNLLWGDVMTNVPTPLGPHWATPKDYVDNLSTLAFQYYFHGSQSNTPMADYKNMARSDVARGVIFTNTFSGLTSSSNGVYIISYLATNALNLTAIREGIYTVNWNMYISGVGGPALSITPEIYRWISAGNEIEIGTGLPQSISTSGFNYIQEITVPTNVVISATDRILVKFKMTGINGTVTLRCVSEGTTSAGISVPVNSAVFVEKAGSTMTGTLIGPSSQWASSVSASNVIVTNGLFMTNRIVAVATNEPVVMLDFSAGRDWYDVANSLEANITFQPTNLMQGRELLLFFSAANNNYTVTITNLAGTDIRWCVNNSTNGATSFTVTNGYRAELSIACRLGNVLEAVYAHFR